MSKDLFDRHVSPPHPGEVLREDLMPALAIGVRELSRHLGISQRRLADLLAERRPVTLDLAVRLGAALGQGPRFWLGLQIQHDLWLAENAAAVTVRPVAWRARAASRGRAVGAPGPRGSP